MDKLKISVDSYRIMTGLKYKNSKVSELVYGIKSANWPAKNRGKETKIWRGAKVDSHLDDNWLNGLKSIKEIKVMATCEGHNEDYVTYIEFQIPTDKYLDLKYLRKIVENLNTGITVCDYDMDEKGSLTYIVSAKLWYGQPGWETWWETIENRIRTAVES